MSNRRPATSHYDGRDGRGNQARHGPSTRTELPMLPPQQRGGSAALGSARPSQWPPAVSSSGWPLADADRPIMDPSRPISMESMRADSRRTAMWRPADPILHGMPGLLPDEQLLLARPHTVAGDPRGRREPAAPAVAAATTNEMLGSWAEGSDWAQAGGGGGGGGGFGASSVLVSACIHMHTYAYICTQQGSVLGKVSAADGGALGSPLELAWLAYRLTCRLTCRLTYVRTLPTDLPTDPAY